MSTEIQQQLARVRAAFIKVRDFDGWEDDAQVRAFINKAISGVDEVERMVGQLPAAEDQAATSMIKDELRAENERLRDENAALAARLDLAKLWVPGSGQQEPVFWYRPCCDGEMYEGPVHNASIEPVRKESGAWIPLYAGPTIPQPAAVPDGWKALGEVIGCFDAAFSEGLTEALAETTDERLKDLVERRLMYALYAAQGAEGKGMDIEAAIASEREACARLCESHHARTKGSSKAKSITQWGANECAAAIRARAATNAPVPPSQEVKDSGYEAQYAIKEGNRIKATEEYFGARPQIDCIDRRRVFEAGFDRGYDAAMSASKEASDGNA